MVIRSFMVSTKVETQSLLKNTFYFCNIHTVVKGQQTIYETSNYLWNF